MLKTISVYAIGATAIAWLMRERDLSEKRVQENTRNRLACAARC